MQAPPDWFRVSNVDDVPSPAVLLYLERVEENIERAIAITGGATRLRPHVKTHKMSEMVQRHLARGVSAFKCATLAEAAMTAAAGARDVLLAYQPVGPNVRGLLELTRRFPQTQFSTIIDDEAAAMELGNVFAQAGRTVDVLLDLDCGMGRTGIVPGESAAALYQKLSRLPGLRAAGLHAYDGHIHDTDVAQRTAACEQAFSPVTDFRRRLIDQNLSVPRLVAGGTPTFPMHARHPDVECSPGTYVFWDFGYAEGMPDLPFQVAALLLTRVVSKPATNRLCLDLGHKAVAAENPPPRVKFLNLPDARAVMHSEEHLVVETSQAAGLAVGDVLFGVPRHICPTIALHAEAVVVRNGSASEHWKISRARGI